MNRHFSRKNLVKKRALDGDSWRWVPMLAIFILLLSGVMFFIYHHKSQMNSLASASTFSTYYSKITSWIAERRTHLVKKVANAKRTTTNQNEAEPQIHFEFYTALPNMQVAGSDSVAKKVQKTPAAKLNVDIADAEELEHELSDASNEAR